MVKLVGGRRVAPFASSRSTSPALLYLIGYISSMNAIRSLRETLGMTQTQLAALAGTSQSAIAAYENGAKSPTLRTLERIAATARCHVEVSYFPSLTREDRRSLALHGAIASQLRETPDAVLARARKSLARMRALHPGARPLLDEWRVLLRRPLDALIPVLSDPSPWACELRHVTPFTGVLSATERARVYREFAQSEGALTTDPSCGRLTTQFVQQLPHEYRSLT